MAAWLKQQLGLGRRRFRQPPGGFNDVEDCVNAACIHPLKLPRMPRQHRVSADDTPGSELMLPMIPTKHHGYLPQPPGMLVSR